MKAATWQGENRFTLDEVPEPDAPAPGQVLVAVHTAGDLRHRRPRHAGPVPVEAAARDGPRVHRGHRRCRTRREPAPDRARGGVRAQLRVWRVRRVPGAPGEPLPAHLARGRLCRARGPAALGGAGVARRARPRHRGPDGAGRLLPGRARDVQDAAPTPRCSSSAAASWVCSPWRWPRSAGRPAPSCPIPSRSAGRSPAVSAPTTSSTPCARISGRRSGS